MKIEQQNPNQNTFFKNADNPEAEEKPLQGYMKSKPRYEVLDGLRGVAAYMVICFHICEDVGHGAAYQAINHGYLAVDFFYVLSGFVIGYAYDDRWHKMSYGDFFKRRLVRLHPMVIAGTLVGFCFYFFGAHKGDFPLIENVPAWKFLLTFLVSLLNLPLPVPMDIRGWAETNSFNGPAWTLQYEYIANIVYAFLFRFCNLYIMLLFLLLGLFLTVNLTLNLDLFKVLDGRGQTTHTVIGGWCLSGQQILIGFTRLLYPFTAGLILSRLKKTIKLRHGFWFCSAILIVIFSLPRFGGEQSLFNGIYECVVIVLIFPLIILLGAGSSDMSEGKLVKFLGEISYPIYITHYPLIYMHIQVNRNFPDLGAFHKVMHAIGLILVATFNAYALLQLYDTPVRKWLTAKVLVNRKHIAAINERFVHKEEIPLEKSEDSKRNSAAILRPTVNSEA